MMAEAGIKKREKESIIEVDEAGKFEDL